MLDYRYVIPWTTYVFKKTVFYGSLMIKYIVKNESGNERSVNTAYRGMIMKVLHIGKK